MGWMGMHYCQALWAVSFSVVGQSRAVPQRAGTATVYPPRRCATRRTIAKTEPMKPTVLVTRPSFLAIGLPFATLMGFAKSAPTRLCHAAWRGKLLHPFPRIHVFA